jgi:hypothetical protein
VRSTVLCSQLPVDKWHAYLGEPTFSGRDLGPLGSHHSHRIELKTGGDSMRKSPPLPEAAPVTTDAVPGAKPRK